MDSEFEQTDDYKRGARDGGQGHKNECLYPQSSAYRRALDRAVASNALSADSLGGLQNDFDFHVGPRTARSGVHGA